MTTRLLLAAALLSVGACTSHAVSQQDDVEFASLLLARTDEGPQETPAETQERPAAPADRPVLPTRTRVDAWRGLVAIEGDELAKLEHTAASDPALDRRLQQPVTADELAALAVLRSPSVTAAWAGYQAALTAYDQSADLDDLVGLYRSYTRQLDTRVGPQRSRRSTEMIAPAPNVSGLSAEIAVRRADAVFETLRATIRDTVSAAWTAHADAARLAEARRIVAAEVELDDALIDVLRARLETGAADQAGFLAFEARREKLRTELAVLERRQGVVRAEWNRLLSRPESSSVDLGVEPTAAISALDADDEAAVIATALEQNQELRAARLTAERAAIALRMMESMALPHLDIGSSRFERERTGEAGVQRGPTFPSPGRGIMPRADFGVRDAQVAGMRARVEAATAAQEALRDAVRTRTRTALFAADAARLRYRVHADDLVALAEQGLDSVRGAYESGEAGYLDLLESVRGLLDARLGSANARRDLQHARAQLLRTTGIDTQRGR